MILQSSHVIVDCPICGRPLEMQFQLVGYEVTCRHCRGEFIVRETDDGSLITATRRGTDPLKRAEQLLHVTCDTDLSASERRCKQRFQLVSALSCKGGLDDSPTTSLKDAKSKREPEPIVLLVEHRDEVFARLATDISESGVRVIRAKSVAEALKMYDTYEPVLLAGNVDLPDQSGWLMTAKLRLFDRRICVWLYQRQPSIYDHDIAKFLDVDELLTYQGDLFGLSKKILDLMDNRRASQDGEDDTNRTGKPTAA